MILEIKRFYFDKKIEKVCPKCKKKVIRDFEEDYLFYPETDVPISISFNCNECDYDWEEDYILTINLDKVIDEKKSN